jgi:putative protein kinase ArgK-like GTPase of G3E family
MLPVTELAGAAVTALVPYLKMGAASLVKKVGSTAGEHLGGLYDKVKSRLTSSGKEALTDLEKAPADADAQAALRHHLKKQLSEDPSLQAHVAELVEALRSGKTAQVLQTSSITGDHNVSVQIAGSGNEVSDLGKRS